MSTSHQLSGSVVKPVLILVRMLAGGILVAAALATPGFLSATSLLSLLTTMSFVGCVAAGMTFITLSGNVMSFCLGATLSATTIVFMACLPVGLAGALVLAFLFSAVLTGAQGWVVGYFRANPRPVRYQPAKRDKRSLNRRREAPCALVEKTGSSWPGAVDPDQRSVT